MRQRELPMNRRSLLKGAAAGAVVPVLPPGLRAAAATAGTIARRVRASDTAWPGEADWEKLNQAVGGNLIKVQSPLAACGQAADETACRQVFEALRNPYYIGDEVGLTQSAGWVDAWISAPSVYAVAARGTADVVAAVNFARGNNLRLVVKGGGHSYLGTSNAVDSLLIWTRAMHSTVLHDAFVGQGCDTIQAPQPAVTVEAGAMWIDVYDAVTTKAGRYVQGGGCVTVGVAGLIQSGGFGSFSKNFGTAAAGLLEAEIVTADGAVCIANACTNPDLFWALKGGGGGSFGVVTKLTLRTHELPAWFGGTLLTIKAISADAFRRLIGQFVSFYNERLFNPHWGEGITLRPNDTLAITMVSQGLDKRQAETVWQPFLDWMGAAPQDFTLASTPIIGSIPAHNWWDADFRRKTLPNTVHTDDRPGAPETHFWWAGNQNEIGIFWHGYQSIWLPASLLQKDRQQALADALFASSRHWPVYVQFNKGLAGAPPEVITAARDTAMNPAVLDAFALAIIAGGHAATYPGVPGHEPDLALARQNAGKIEQSMAELRKIAPNGGSYVSETNFFEPSWQQSFWGSNYPRLRAVKAKYDPTVLFFVHHGVGSEEWSADGFARLSGP
jgi:FAD/FMN-containing dehydrogenase